METKTTFSEQKLRGTVLSQEPILIYSGGYAGNEEPNPFTLLQDHLRGLEVIWLVILPWTAEPDSYYGKIACDWRSERLERNPKHRIIFLTNTRYEERLLFALGAESFFLNHNAFVDSDLFKPQFDIESANRSKRYLAVYNAQFLKFKRHELCVGLPQDRLALIGYNFEAGYFDHVKSILPKACYLNINPDGSTKWLMQPDVNEVYNQASVALCLSDREGAMHASMEYLLSGLPIVTTVNKGGRDFFFDGRYVRWCNADAKGVVETVHALEADSPPAGFIREETLRKVDYHLEERLPLLARMLGISHSDLKQCISSNFNDKLITPISLESILVDLSEYAGVSL